METVVSIRGAITSKENSVKSIKEATTTMVSSILTQNNIQEEDIINIIFTCTDDLNAINPATVAREEFKLFSTPMLCLQEMKIQNGLKMCIRVLVQVYSELAKDKVKHAYMGDAKLLRPDLSYEM